MSITWISWLSTFFFSASCWSFTIWRSLALAASFLACSSYKYILIQYKQPLGVDALITEFAMVKVPVIWRRDSSAFPRLVRPSRRSCPDQRSNEAVVLQGPHVSQRTVLPFAGWSLSNVYKIQTISSYIKMLQTYVDYFIVA